MNFMKRIWNTLKDNWLMVVVAFMAVFAGAWSQYIYSNGHHIIFDVFDKILIFVSNNLGAVIAIFAFMVSVGSLWQNRRHNKLSVKPKLTFKSGHDSKERYVHLINTGLGPAIIKNYTINLNDNVIEQSFDAFGKAISSVLPDINISFFHMTVIGDGTSLLPGDHIDLLKVDISKMTADEKDSLINELLSKIEFEIEFESLYREKGNIYYNLNE